MLVKRYAYGLCLLSVMLIVYVLCLLRVKIEFMFVVLKAYVCVKLCCAIQ